jgi:Crp-like helix-turn-helix protein
MYERRPGPTASLLYYDAECRDLVPENELTVARRKLSGPVLRLASGPTTAIQRLSLREDIWGFYVISGMLFRGVTVSRATLPQLIGPSEVIGPTIRSDSVVPVRQTFAAVDETRLLVLDAGALRAMARWPSIIMLLERRRSAERLRAGTLGAIAQLPNVEARLLATLWHLAETWGHPTPDGTVMPFALTHEMLGRFVAARRPTVTLGLQKLAAEQLIQRLADGSWLLRRRSDVALRAMLTTER